MLKNIKDRSKKNRELIVYLVCGFLTFVVSMIAYALLSEVFKINVLVANIITWIIAVYFAFSVNRKFVFKSNGNFTSELIQFYLGRVVTLVVEQAMLYIFIIRLMFNNMAIKSIAQVVIIILNYIISKFIVFKKEKSSE
ncbi:GtrA-like protein [Catonella morbi ATCC 51271]|uniref:GtrA-like protein n=1 Tax=Catonella morbi ATCC 51271 TaxID=592026 RepID=V2ZA33_9FIRM|nr:GtrA family protein [Catonella morbi]ESL03785.1 GtrA-like protein [Catonella morbi ATCC 51271]